MPAVGTFRYSLTNQKFGRLTVTGFSHLEGKTSIWNCVCKCGNSIQVKRYNLVRPDGTRSCGCASKRKK